MIPPKVIMDEELPVAPTLDDPTATAFASLLDIDVALCVAVRELVELVNAFDVHVLVLDTALMLVS
mgnify:CR=1 FL=1